MFNNQLKDIFANHTRLTQVRRNGDLKIDGEILQYSQRNKSVSSEGYSAQTELSITVNVRFINTKNHKEDFERQFTATASALFPTSLCLRLSQSDGEQAVLQLNCTIVRPTLRRAIIGLLPALLFVPRLR